LLVATSLALFGLVAFGSGEARAGYNVTLSSITGGGSDFTWNYTVSITANQESVTAGNFFRFYDFSGYIPGTAVGPANFIATVANSNPVPPPNVILQHGDDPGIPNITYTYTGAVPLTGPVVIGTFSIQSTFGGQAIKDFAGQSTNTQTGSVIDSRTDVLVAIPEPTSVVSLGLGGIVLLGLGYTRLRGRTGSV
jgi:hypothetical protein